jgi:hypothetical protein
MRKMVKTLFGQLLARGYSPDRIRLRIFRQALLRQGTERPAPVQEDTNRRVYLPLPYHPMDSRSIEIQRIFRDLFSSPKDETPTSATNPTRSHLTLTVQVRLYYSYPWKKIKLQTAPDPARVGGI